MPFLNQSSLKLKFNHVLKFRQIPRLLSPPRVISREMMHDDSRILHCLTETRHSCMTRLMTGPLINLSFRRYLSTTVLNMSSHDMATDPNPLTPVLEEKLRNVTEAVVNKPPLCSGTWEIPPESFQLFFKRGDDARYVSKPILLARWHAILK
jgi:hypothetical protein